MIDFFLRYRWLRTAPLSVSLPTLLLRRLTQISFRSIRSSTSARFIGFLLRSPAPSRAPNRCPFRTSTAKKPAKPSSSRSYSCSEQHHRHSQRDDSAYDPCHRLGRSSRRRRTLRSTRRPRLRRRRRSTLPFPTRRRRTRHRRRSRLSQNDVSRERERGEGRTWYPIAEAGKRSEDWCVTQLEEAGTRGVQGRVEVAGREVGWLQVCAAEGLVASRAGGEGTDWIRRRCRL